MKGIGDGKEQEEEVESVEEEEEAEGVGREFGKKKSMGPKNSGNTNNGTWGESQYKAGKESALGDGGVRKEGEGESNRGSSSVAGGEAALNIATALEDAEIEEDVTRKASFKAGDNDTVCCSIEDGEMADSKHREEEVAGGDEEVRANDSVSLLLGTADPAEAAQTTDMDVDLDVDQDMRVAILSTFPQSLLDGLIESMCESLRACDKLDIRLVAKRFVSDVAVQERYGAVFRLCPFLDFITVFSSTFNFLSSEIIDNLRREKGREEGEDLEEEEEGEEREEEEEAGNESDADRLQQQYSADRICSEEQEAVLRQTALDFNIFMRMHQATHSFQYLAEWYSRNLPEGETSKVVEQMTLRGLCSRYPNMFRMQGQGQGGDVATVLALDVQQEENRVKLKQQRRVERDMKKAAAAVTHGGSHEDIRSVAQQEDKARVEAIQLETSRRLREFEQERLEELQKRQIADDRRKSEREIERSGAVRASSEGGEGAREGRDHSFPKQVLKKIAHSFRDYLQQHPSSSQLQAIKSFSKTFKAASTEAAAIKHYTLHRICARFIDVFKVKRCEDGTEVILLVDSRAVTNKSQLINENMRMKQDNAIRKVQQAEEERIRKEIAEQNDRDNAKASTSTSTTAPAHSHNGKEVEVRQESKGKKDKKREDKERKDKEREDKEREDKEREDNEREDKEREKDNERESAAKRVPRYPIQTLKAAAGEFHRYLLQPKFRGSRIPYPQQVEGFCESGRSQGRNVVKAMGAKLFCAAVPEVLMIARNNDIYTVIPSFTRRLQEDVTEDGVCTVGQQQHLVRDIKAAAVTFASYLHAHSSHSQASSSSTSKSPRLSGTT